MPKSLLRKKDIVKPVLNEARRTLSEILTLGIPKKIAEAMVARQVEKGLADAAEITDSEQKSFNKETRP